MVELIIGTYEHLLLGYKFKSTEETGGLPNLSVTFTAKPHTGSIRSVATGGKYVLSGGSDDKIIIYDMSTRREVNVILNHEGSINAVTFTPDNTHFLSGGDDGRMIATRVGTWQVGGDWKKAHNGSPVTHISCHPSGKLALSLGRDLTLKTWNLVTGRCAFTTNLKSRSSLGKSINCVKWSMDGNYFALTGLRAVEILSVTSAKSVREIQLDSNPVSICWISDIFFMVGLENGKLLLTSINENEELKYIDGHKGRIKDIAFANNTLASASSTGDITFWTIDLDKKICSRTASTNIGCRPTCIALLDQSKFNHIPPVEEIDLNEISKLHEIAQTTRKHKITDGGVGKVEVVYENDDSDHNETTDQKKKSVKLSSKKLAVKLSSKKLAAKKKIKISKKTKISELAVTKKKKKI